MTSLFDVVVKDAFIGDLQVTWENEPSKLGNVLQQLLVLSKLNSVDLLLSRGHLVGWDHGTVWKGLFGRYMGVVAHSICTEESRVEVF